MQNIVKTRDFVSFNRSFWPDVSWGLFCSDVFCELTSPPFFNFFPRILRAQAGLSNSYKCDRPLFRQQFKILTSSHFSPQSDGAAATQGCNWGQGRQALLGRRLKIHWYGASFALWWRLFIDYLTTFKHRLLWRCYLRCSAADLQHCSG